MRSKAQFGGKINKYVFRDMIKDLDLGFTHLEIEEIMNKICMSRDGWINIDDFIKFANTPIKIFPRNIWIQYIQSYIFQAGQTAFISRFIIEIHASEFSRIFIAE